MTSSLGSAAANPTQVAENLPSSLVGLASAFPGSAHHQKPNYGLAMRFKVRIVELNADLGHWSSCGGLKVDFSPTPIRSGGEYLAMQFLPGDAKFSRIVLRRAIDPESSALVQQWLKLAAEQWVNGERPNTNPGTAQVTLLNAKGEDVMTWTLENVRPAAWSGPDLDATSSKVAIETLELVHSGFKVRVARKENQPPVAPANAVPAPPDTQQQFKLTDRDGRAVQFFWRPERITVKRTNEAVSLGTTDGQSIEAGDRPHQTTLTLSKLIINGQHTKPNAERLLAWGTKAATSGGGAGSTTTGGGTTRPSPGASRGNELDALPYVRLQWGMLDHWVKVKSVDVAYIRFSNTGTPVRAEVTLTLYVVPAPGSLKQNPSSGGIPGRAAHTLVLSENLQQLAQHNYGSPRHWRDIADANGIDDPLRVRPGTTLFLPAESELAKPGSGR